MICTTSRKRLFSAVVAVAAALAPSNTGLAGDDSGEDGNAAPFLRVWQVQVTPDQPTAQAGKFAFNDLMVFEEDGFFTAEAFGPMGYGRSEYTLTPLSATATGFTTTLANGESVVVWNGVLQNSRIVGTLVWSRADGSVGTYDFSAAPAE
ncbi:MAG TPA: hypothetical protein PLD59_03150 [Tepidisphaeraceae bacterium]|nr:hypothetical protein [Tepidisphaeraceae bacterium]